jgi:hypothetical protein
MEIAPQMLAAMVAQGVSSLAGGQGCCPHGCAGCEALLHLILSDQLAEIIAPYVHRYGKGLDWWDEEAEKVDVSWLMERWCNPQNCEYVELMQAGSGKPKWKILEEFNARVLEGIPYDG